MSLSLSDSSLHLSRVINSSGCGDKFACARVGSALLASASAPRVRSSLACLSDAVVAHARPSLMHVAHNSWSDTVRVKGPTGRRSTKGGVSGPAGDLRPVPEVEAGVNFRPAGGVRGAGCRFTSQEATRHRNQAGQGKCGHNLPSTRRFLILCLCHLDQARASGNQWAGRRCVVPHGRGFGG